MTIEEYREKINAAVSNPDRIPMIATELLEGITNDLTALDSMLKLKAENEARIAELQTINQQLFIRSTAPAEQIESEATPEDALADMVSKLTGGTPNE